MYSKEYDFFSCAYYPFAYSTGGEIWNPETNDVYGILNSEVNAAAMEKFVGLRSTSRRPSPPRIGDMIDLFTRVAHSPPSNGWPSVPSCTTRRLPKWRNHPISTWRFRFEIPGTGWRCQHHRCNGWSAVGDQLLQR